MKNKTNFQEFFIGLVFSIASFFLFGIFLLESKLIDAINTASDEQMINLVTVKIITLAIITITATIYAYHLKRNTLHAK